MAHVAACVQTLRLFSLIHFLSSVCLKMYLHDSVPLASLNIVKGHFPISSFLKNTEEEGDIVGWGQSEIKIDKEGE